MTTQEITNKALEIWSYLYSEGWVMFVLYIFVGFILARVIRKVFLRLLNKEHMPRQVGRFLSKFIVALIWVMAGVQALRAIGVDLVSILGAAGVAGVAIGFASQTALSNLISGIFLVTERSFLVGDYVRVSGLEGTVESVNLLSIYLRQPDNALIRIPCETIIKNPVVNFTKDELRRSDYDVGVDYSTNLEQVQTVVKEVVSRMEILPKAHPPVIQFLSFADSALTVRIGIWCYANDYHHSRYAFAKALSDAFRAAGISIPFPIRDVRLTKES